MYISIIIVRAPPTIMCFVGFCFLLNQNNLPSILSAEKANHRFFKAAFGKWVRMQNKILAPLCLSFNYSCIFLTTNKSKKRNESILSVKS